MAFRFMIIPVQSPESAEAELNAFLASHAAANAIKDNE